MVRRRIGARIGNKYEIKEVITHRDHEVSVYVATDIQTQEEVALKLSYAVDRIELEANFYEDSIQDLEGFPRKKWFWKVKHCGYGALALDRLGPTLDNLMKESKFGLKTTLQVMDQVITRIQTLHERHIVHRGIKPDNFCIGPRGSKTESKVYMIDFDMSKAYVTSDGSHIEDEDECGGNRYWTSLAVDEGYEGVRRDDMESAGYLAVYLLQGYLPWFTEYNNSGVSTRRCKAETTLVELCTDLPEELSTYLTYCQSLDFKQQPDYDYCRGLFRKVFEREGFRDDGVYDWVAPESVVEQPESLEDQQSSGDSQTSDQSEEECSSVPPSCDDNTVEQALASHLKTTEACPVEHMDMQLRQILKIRT
ncbi:serine/threonine protein kinase [Cryptococcus wingfieldii CBS 7118]|uniref:Serine/threonine protein kinase n=1 Tax=Cryptococcus wingfieldii CBS 7118 TaxID=1295528 RepID=A0A1E3IY32_9TREE|nr:serine/threonine protein kinase [Cryptococcus wingfieldii CBS 7118]ODN93514.1 serine/threonine protein kinase [Cryptococcus wingfieldii CBS 7118]